MSRNNPPAIRLEIAGGIASGKTTLARILRARTRTCILEDFRRNPFVGAFYRDPAAFALETEVSFALQHFHALKRRFQPTRLSVLDHSFYLDEAYADVTLNAQERRAHQVVLDVIRRHAGSDVLVVHLKCSAETQLRRIRARQRAMEQSIQKAYLASLNAALDRRLADINPKRVFRIDSGRIDFAHNEDSRRRIRLALKQWISSARSL
jgi:deoxyadenosine/deoxycytidine kinase